MISKEGNNKKKSETPTALVITLKEKSGKDKSVVP